MRKDKGRDERSGHARGDKEKLTALSEGGEEDGREKERKRGTGEEKFGGDFQVRRVAHVKAIHSITLWGHRELPLPLRFAPSLVYTLVHARVYVCAWYVSLSLSLSLRVYSFRSAEITFMENPQKRRRALCFFPRRRQKVRSTNATQIEFCNFYLQFFPPRRVIRD